MKAKRIFLQQTNLIMIYRQIKTSLVVRENSSNHLNLHLITHLVIKSKLIQGVISRDYLRMKSKENLILIKNWLVHF